MNSKALVHRTERLYWELSWDTTPRGYLVEVARGNLGTPGRVQTKLFPTANDAQRFLVKELERAQADGYEEVDSLDDVVLDPEAPPTPALDELRRGAHAPSTVEGDGEIDGSKFSGRPWLAAGESWPRCKTCESTMQLLLQLRLDDLPEPWNKEIGAGVLQVFYCDDGCETDSWKPFAPTALCRVMDTTQEPRPDPALVSPLSPFPPRRITAWQTAIELPAFDEPEVENAELSDYEQGVLDDAERAGGDKLGGWAQWVQYSERPACPKCRDPMRVIFQIDSNVNVPIIWGDTGCAYIVQCPGHKKQITLLWQGC